MYQAGQSDQGAAQHKGTGRVGTVVFATRILAVGTLLLGTAKAPTAAASAAVTDFAPTERQAKVARLVSSMFERSHYRQAPVNDPVPSLLLDSARAATFKWANGSRPSEIPSAMATQ